MLGCQNAFGLNYWTGTARMACRDLSGTGDWRGRARSGVVASARGNPFQNRRPGHREVTPSRIFSHPGSPATSAQGQRLMDRSSPRNYNGSQSFNDVAVWSVESQSTVSGGEGLAPASPQPQPLRVGHFQVSDSATVLESTSHRKRLRRASSSTCKMPDLVTPS